MTTFKQMGLKEPILRAIDSAGYVSPTPIQAGLIPVLLEGHDAVGIAQTGTGKTAAFILPLLNELAERTGPSEPRGCKALIVTPTRELAAQIADNIAVYSKYISIRHAVVVGGVRPNRQIRDMARGVDILVATPGRLLDHMGTGAIRIDKTHAVVLDEADQMLDLGFLPAIRRIMTALPNDRRTALLSATMPKEIRTLAADFLNTPVDVSVAPASKPVDRIDQRVILVDRRAKSALLVDLLKETELESAIVFTRTKRGADKVARQLEKGGLKAAAIHGNKTQGQRVRTLDAFKSGKTTILVATDIAARGLDIDGVSHVINYDLPNVPEAYVHRIGRTARAGRQGVAIAFCDAEERPLLRDIEKLIKATLDKESAGPEYEEIAQQAAAHHAGSESTPRKARTRPQKTRKRSTPGASAKRKPKGNLGPEAKDTAPKDHKERRSPSDTPPTHSKKAETADRPKRTRRRRPRRRKEKRGAAQA
ncbi:MAG: DEAD/DEAH box helicase [Pseudomonadota bacterium]